MKKRHKQLIKKILKEEIGSVQSHQGHEWTVENPYHAFDRLPESFVSIILEWRKNRRQKKKRS